MPRDDITDMSGLIIGPVLLAIAMQAVEEAHQTYQHMA